MKITYFDLSRIAREFHQPQSPDGAKALEVPRRERAPKPANPLSCMNLDMRYIKADGLALCVRAKSERKV